MSVNIRTRGSRYAVRVVIVAVAAVVGSHVEEARASTAAHAQVVARVAPAGGPAAGRVLGGVTSQHWPVIIGLASNGRRLSAQVAFDMHCTSGNAWTAPDGWTGVPVPASGNVHAFTAVTPSAGSATQDAITGGQDTLTGKLNRKRATFSGVRELQLNFTSPSGQPDSCDSGRVAFSVRL